MYVCWYCKHYKKSENEEPCVNCGDNKKNYKLWLVKDNE